MPGVRAAAEFVLDVVAGSTLTAYDAEFVALASALTVPFGDSR
jgi:predicted nucleic acid-binding protein